MAQITQFDLISDSDKHLVEEFINSALVQVKRQSIRAYKSSLGLFYLCMDDVAVSEAKKVKRKHIVYWLKELNDRKYVASTKIHHIFHIRMYLSWLYEMKYSRKNPQILILQSDFPKLPKKLPRPLSPTVDQKLIEYLTQSENVLNKCLLLMRYTGLRLSDLLSLEYNPLFADENGRSYIRVISPKFDKQYSLPVEQKTADIILWLQKKQAVDLAAATHLVKDPEGRSMDVLLRNHLSAISPFISDIHITPHQLRHTFATSMINAGMGLYSVMKLLGHMDMRMTLRYAELYPTTLHAEFHSAVKNLTEQYQLDPKPSPETEFDPLRALDDVNRWLRNSNRLNEKNLLHLTKRLSRLKTEMDDLLK